MERITLTLGPCLFNWPQERLRDFYAEMAEEAPLDRVYLGEVICGKRMPFSDPLWPGIIERLERAGKEVVLSLLALPTTVRERRAMSELAGLDRLIEINDFSCLLPRQGRPFIAGPFLNVYNEAALGSLSARGAVAWCPPVEVALSSVTTVARAAPLIHVELFAFGRLPLALSGRCYHARLHGRTKDSCGYVCDRDPDGLEVSTLDGQGFLAVNGIQTLSSAFQAVLMSAAALARAGVAALRLSPHGIGMLRVTQTYRSLLDGVLDLEDAREALLALGLPGALCDGYLAGAPGWRRVAAAEEPPTA